MKQDRRSYNADYKTVSVRLAVERNNVSSIARHLSVRSTRLQRWVGLATEPPENPFRKSGNARDAEIQNLLRENRRSREDKEILTKAAAIFTKSQK